MDATRHRPRQVANRIVPQEPWIYYDLVLATRRLQSRAALLEASVTADVAISGEKTASRASTLPATSAVTGSDDSGAKSG